jgi:hypothetical protein
MCLCCGDYSRTSYSLLTSCASPVCIMIDRFPYIYSSCMPKAASRRLTHVIDGTFLITYVSLLLAWRDRSRLRSQWKAYQGVRKKSKYHIGLWFLAYFHSGQLRENNVGVFVTLCVSQLRDVRQFPQDGYHAMSSDYTLLSDQGIYVPHQKCHTNRQVGQLGNQMNMQVMCSLWSLDDLVSVNKLKCGLKICSVVEYELWGGKDKMTFKWWNWSWLSFFLEKEQNLDQ